jgi:hypothetical protein
VGLDPRRPGFPWYALGLERMSYFRATCWLFLPVVATALAASQALGNEPAGTALLIPGLFLAGTPRLFDRYGQFVRERRDHRGGPATLSMWLLYIYRIARSVLLCLAFATLVISAAPMMRGSMLRLSSILTVVLIALLVLRTLGGIVYRRIDQMGSRFGFAATSQRDHGR